MGRLDERLVRRGRSLARGAVTEIARLAIIGLILIGVFTIIMDLFSIGVDATDASSHRRSGLKLRTDYGTGCQYLETRGGGVTPRLGQDGRQVCAIGDRTGGRNG